MQRDLIRSLVRCAEQMLEAGGHSPNEQTLAKVADTLRAAALDDELRELVSAGRVVKEERAAGLGPLEVLPPAPKKAKAKKSKKPRKPAGPDPTQVAEAERAVEAARRALEEAERRRSELG